MVAYKVVAGKSLRRSRRELKMLIGSGNISPLKFVFS
jgi:hypothetical protein